MNDTSFGVVSLLFTVALLIAVTVMIERKFDALDSKLLLLEQNLTFVCESRP